MLPIVVLSPAWAEAEGMSYSDIASLFGIDPASAVPARAGDLCPRCGNHHADSAIRLFVPEPATATPEQVEGRAVVKCLCGTTYWLAAVHPVDVHQLIGQAVVRAASAPRPVAPPPPPVVPFPPALYVPIAGQQDDNAWLLRSRALEASRYYVTARPNPDDAAGPVYYRRGPIMNDDVEGRCPRCKKPLGPLDRTELVNGVRQHAQQPCPEPARPTGARPFSFLPEFPPR